MQINFITQVFKENLFQFILMSQKSIESLDILQRKKQLRKMEDGRKRYRLVISPFSRGLN